MIPKQNKNFNNDRNIFNLAKNKTERYLSGFGSIQGQKLSRKW